MQGRQYFEQVPRAGALVQPLLLYYGVMSLARALILYLLTNAREASLPSQHGLESVGWREELAQQGGSISNLRIRTHSGTFSSLALATKQVEYTTVYVAPYPSMLTVRYEYATAFPPDWTVSLQSILSRIPELHSTCEDVFEDFSIARPTFVFLLTNGPYRTTFLVPASKLGLPDEARVRQDLSLAPTDQMAVHTQHQFLGAVQHWQVSQPRDTLEAVISNLPYLLNDAGRAAYAVPLWPEGVRLSKLSMLYAISYALGMLSRYYPSHWMTLLNGGRGDAIMPVLSAALDIIEDRYPALILDQFRL
jgi:hypothetical protein